MLPYYTIKEVAAKSGLSSDQVIRLGFAGQLVFAIRKHTPQNYKEVEETQNSDGSRTVRTRTNETQVIAKLEGPALRLSYVSPEDVINIITNDAPNRRTLVRATYQTRDLDPKQGTWQFNCPLELTPADLVVSADEWLRFERGPGKQLKALLPLVPPERVTVKWLLSNLSIPQWLAAVTAIASVFGVGVYAAQTAAYQQMASMLRPAAATAPARPNPSLEARPHGGSPSPASAAVQHAPAGSGILPSTPPELER